MNQFHVLLPFSFRLERASRKKSILIADAISRRHSQPGKKNGMCWMRRKKNIRNAFKKCLKEEKKQTNIWIHLFLIENDTDDERQ